MQFRSFVGYADVLLHALSHSFYLLHPIYGKRFFNGRCTAWACEAMLHVSDEIFWRDSPCCFVGPSGQITPHSTVLQFASFRPLTLRKTIMWNARLIVVL